MVKASRRLCGADPKGLALTAWQLMPNRRQDGEGLGYDGPVHHVDGRDLYNKHIHDSAERRFVAESVGGKELVGLVEVIEIDYIHRKAEFQIIISPEHQGQGYSREMTEKALDYSFNILNLHKIYLQVAVENVKAIHIYNKCGFREEGHLVEEYFINGCYQDAKRMYLLQDEFLKRHLGK